MYCKHVQRELSAYLDREVTLSKQKKIEKHLAKCNECKSKYEELKLTMEKVSFYPEIEVSNNFTNKVMSRIEKEKISFEDCLNKLVTSHKMVSSIVLLFFLIGLVSLVMIANKLPIFIVGKVFYHLFSSSYFVSDKLVQVYPELRIFLQSASFISFLSFIFILQKVKRWDKSK